MTLTVAQRAGARAQWRGLATACFIATQEQFAGAADVDGFRAEAKEAWTHWQSPLDDDAASFALFSFARLAWAFCKAKKSDRPAYAPALHLMAELAADLLQAGEPPPPPLLPFRADIDG